jgi:hypothetical protein
MRLTTVGWVLVAAVVATAVMAVVAPGVAIVIAVVIAVVLLAAFAEGMTDSAGWFDVGVAAERKSSAIARWLKRGRPEWETTPPDHADEPADAVWERERKRRGLG